MQSPIDPYFGMTIAKILRPVLAWQLSCQGNDAAYVFSTNPISLWNQFTYLPTTRLDTEATEIICIIRFIYVSPNICNMACVMYYP